MDGDDSGEHWVSTHEDADGVLIGPDGYGRTNDATLWSYEWQNGTGAYLIYLDRVANGHRFARDHVATVHFDGRVERHAQPAGHERRPSSHVLDAYAEGGTVRGSGERGEPSPPG